jgi:hypothetical protein
MPSYSLAAQCIAAAICSGVLFSICVMLLHWLTLNGSK